MIDDFATTDVPILYILYTHYYLYIYILIENMFLLTIKKNTLRYRKTNYNEGTCPGNESA